MKHEITANLHDRIADVSHIRHKGTTRKELNCTTLNCTKLTLHCHCTKLHCTALHFFALHRKINISSFNTKKINQNQSNNAKFQLSTKRPKRQLRLHKSWRVQTPELVESEGKAIRNNMKMNWGHVLYHIYQQNSASWNDLEVLDSLTMCELPSIRFTFSCSQSAVFWIASYLFGNMATCDASRFGWFTNHDSASIRDHLVISSISSICIWIPNTKKENKTSGHFYFWNWNWKLKMNSFDLLNYEFLKSSFSWSVNKHYRKCFTFVEILLQFSLRFWVIIFY